MAVCLDERKLPHEDFHEIWWIYSPHRHPWGGLRIAHFRKPINYGPDNEIMLVIIDGEIDKRRIGIRIWNDIEEREGWVKVKQIELPTRGDIDRAVDAKLSQIAQDVTRKVLERDDDG